MDVQVSPSLLCDVWDARMACYSPRLAPEKGLCYNATTGYAPVWGDALALRLRVWDIGKL